MTTAVPTDGFIAPPANAGAAPPANAQPGFVQPPPAGTPAPAAPVPAQAGADVAALTAALTAALASQQAAVAPAAAPAAAVEGSDDPILRSMAAVLKTAAQGIDLDRLLGKAIEYGDAGLIDTAYLTEKGGVNAAQLLTIAQGIVESTNAKASAVEKEVHGLAGSEANWNACATAFNTKADPALRAVVAQMLDSKKSDQIKAAAKLVVDFAKGTGIVPTPAGLVTGFGAAPISGQGLSKDEFQTELRKLNPQDRGFVAARQDLYARRQMGKQLGR